MRLGHHRRFTANHTLHLDIAGRRLFVKISPNLTEAIAEAAGHARLRPWYPVPPLLWHRTVGRHAVLVYDRHGDGRPDEGLLLDEINAADHTGNLDRLDDVLSQVISRYDTVIRATVLPLVQDKMITKLYGDRARPGGRLDRYYGTNPPLLVLPDGEAIRPADLTTTTLLVNGHPHRVDFTRLFAWLRKAFDPRALVWAALTQGDPTDLNIGAGPVWFDYDTAGMNALAGEFACFLWYQRLQGGWLVPTYNPAAFADHPRTLSIRSYNQPAVRVERDGRHAVRIDYHHQPSPARRHVIGRYYHDLVCPLADHLGVHDVIDWLRPYLVLRILGVHSLTTLAPDDAALSVAYLAETLSTHAAPEQLLAEPPAVTRSRHDGRHEPDASRPFTDRPATRERPRSQDAPTAC